MNTPRLLLIAAICLLVTPPVLAAPFTISTDGTEVTDSKTGLIWRRCSEGQSWSGSACTGAALVYNHEQALVRVKTQTSWRLPNVKELVSIVDRSLGSPAINATVFPGTVSSWYWSSSPYEDDANVAWYVSFSDGDGDYGSRSSTYYVRLVR